MLELLRCPESGEALEERDGRLVSASGKNSYQVSSGGIPLFAERFVSAEAKSQQEHYDRIAAAYLANLTYPHTQEYMAYLDRVMLSQVRPEGLGTAVEVCCGSGEAFGLLGPRITRGIGLDVSSSMLEAAQKRHAGLPFLFIQGDATRMPLRDGIADSVLMFGGIHHVNDRAGLFKEVCRILKPGGCFYFREPANDFLPWRMLRAIVYRVSPILDAQNERPLRHRETVPVLEAAGMNPQAWRTCGFLGFCLFMNSDVLVVNRLFRFLPGIRFLTRASTHLDEICLKLPLMKNAGLQVVGVAMKPSAPSEPQPK